MMYGRGQLLTLGICPVSLSAVKMLGDVHSSHEVGFSSEESSPCITLSSQKAPLMCSRPEAWWIHHVGGMQKQVMMGSQCNHLSFGKRGLRNPRCVSAKEEATK